MATKKRRKHRRDARRARAHTNRPKIQRFMTKCTNGEHHWIYLTDKGDILLRDHPEVMVAQAVVEAELSHTPCGCFFAALLLSRALRPNDRLFKTQNEWNQRLLTDSLRKLLDEINKKRGKRYDLADQQKAAVMVPFKESLAFRVCLLHARFTHRVRNIANHITKTEEELFVVPGRGRFYSDDYLYSTSGTCSWDY